MLGIRLALAAVPALALASCGAQPSAEPVETSTAPPTTVARSSTTTPTTRATTTSTLGKPVPPPPGSPLPAFTAENVPFEEWPDACAFATDAEVQALVPGAMNVTHAGTRSPIQGGGNTPHATGCKYQFNYPGDYGVKGWVTVDIVRIGVMHAAYRNEFQETRDRFVAKGDYYDLTAEAGGPAYGNNQSTDLEKSGYRLSFHGSMSGRDVLQKSEEVTRNSYVTAVMAFVAARIPAS
jgi:hypothetical protein